MSEFAPYVYRVYGQTFSSNLPFQCCLELGDTPPALRLTFADQPAWSPADWKNAERVSPADLVDDIEIARHGADWGLRAPSKAAFVLSGCECRGWLVDPARPILGEILFLDCVLPYALELAGRPFLHASAVAVEGRAIAFSTYAGGGKSSLTTGLTLRGHPFVTDDVLVLQPSADGCLVFPGYPQIRLWSDAAERLLPPDGHEELHPEWPKRRGLVKRWGRVATEPLPLGALYLVEADETCSEVEISSVRGQQAFFELLENSPAVAALDFATQAARTAQFGDLLRAIPLRRLRYPRNYEAFDGVLDAVLADAGALV